MKPAPRVLEYLSVHDDPPLIPRDQLYAALRQVAKETPNDKGELRWIWNDDEFGLYKFTDHEALDTAEFCLLMGHPVNPKLSSCMMRDMARRLIRIELELTDPGDVYPPASTVAADNVR